MHFDFAGNADRFSDKKELLFLSLMALAFPLISEIWLLIRKKKLRSDKSEAEYRVNAKVLQNFLIALSVFYYGMVILLIFLGFRSVEHLTDSFPGAARVLCILEGFLMIAMGNFLPKSKRNAVFGIRCSWTLYSDVTWAKSNRFGGIAFVVSGVLSILCAWFLPGMWCLYMMIAWILSAAAASMIYAYLVYKEERSHA